MRRRREQSNTRPIIPKVSNKPKQKQQGLTNDKSETGDTTGQSVTSASTHVNKKSN
jgi:hypothetical protein